MTISDILILMVVAVFALWGLWRGLIRELFAAAGLILGLAAAWLLGPALGVSVNIRFIPPLARIIVASVIIIVVVFLAVTLAGWVVRKVVSHGPIGLLDRLGGFLVGALKGAVLLVAIAILVLITPLGGALQGAAERAPLLRLTLKGASLVCERYHRVLKITVRHKIAALMDEGVLQVSGSVAGEEADAPASRQAPPIKTVTLRLDTLSPAAERLVKKIASDPLLAGLNLDEQFENLKASGTTIEIDLDQLSPVARTLVRELLSDPDLQELDLKELTSRAGIDPGKLDINLNRSSLKKSPSHPSR